MTLPQAVHAYSNNITKRSSNYFELCFNPVSNPLNNEKLSPCSESSKHSLQRQKDNKKIQR